MKYSHLCVIFLVNCFLGVNSADCTTSDDCDFLNSICSDEKICDCTVGYVLNINKTKCLPYVTEYYGKCEEDAQCDWLGENSICEYICKCKDGFRWYKGKCQKYVGLGEACTNSLDCFDGYNFQSLTCNNTCECSSGYYPRESDCRKIAKSVNDTCALDIDCTCKNCECHLGKCAVKSAKSLEFEEVSERLLRRVTKDIDPKTCASDSDCVEFSNTECYDKTKTCVCKRGYFLEETLQECTPEIGEATCEDASDCKFRPSKCEDGICYCRDYYFVDDTNRNCVKTISQNNWNCLSKEWCYALGRYSFCSTNETCECSRISEYDNDNTICKTPTTQDPTLCTDDYQCGHIVNGFCLDETCGCRSNFRLVDQNICLPNIGSTCDDNIMKCTIQNANCDENECKCNKNFVNDDKNLTCYPLKNLHEDCEIDTQCSEKIKFAICGDEKKCSCSDNYLESKNMCYERKDYGSYCTDQTQCTLSLGDGVVCRNSICQCRTGYTLKDNKCSSGVINTGSIIILCVTLLYSMFG